MNILLKFLCNTPPYVYLVLAYLIVVGVKSCGERRMSIKKLLLSTFVLSYLVLSSLSKIALSPFYFLMFFGSVSFFGLLGFFVTKRLRAEFSRGKQIFFAPGSLFTLFFVLIVFSMKYYIGFKAFQHIDYFSTGEAKLITSLVTGASFGTLLGRVAKYILCLVSSKPPAATDA